jgi:beta-N-acetylhexosaminidase
MFKSRVNLTIIIGVILNTLSGTSEINTRIGQLFMIGMPGTIMDKDTEALIRDYNPAGIILFSRNVEDPLHLARLCSDLQSIAMKYHGIPLFISIDQEGGRVARLKEPFTIFPGNEAIGKDLDPEGKAREFGETAATEMKLVGLNMNLAPVLDVRSAEPEKHLVGRTFSEDHRVVAKLGVVVIRTLQKNGIMAVAKHFPGLGAANLDPHLHLPVIRSDKKYIEEINLHPFRYAIRARVAGVMTSHALYPSLDPEHPATLSSIILNDMLREKMGYRGLIITDDLEMGAITEQQDIAQGALQSFNAGADILLICKDQDYVRASINLLQKQILSDSAMAERMEQSIARIMKAKKKYIKKMKMPSLKKVEKYFRLR